MLTVLCPNQGFSSPTHPLTHPSTHPPTHPHTRSLCCVQIGASGRVTQRSRRHSVWDHGLLKSVREEEMPGFKRQAARFNAKLNKHHNVSPRTSSHTLTHTRTHALSLSQTHVTHTQSLCVGFFPHTHKLKKILKNDNTAFLFVMGCRSSSSTTTALTFRSGALRSLCGAISRVSLWCWEKEYCTLPHGVWRSGQHMRPRWLQHMRPRWLHLCTPL